MSEFQTTIYASTLFLGLLVTYVTVARRRPAIVDVLLAYAVFAQLTLTQVKIAGVSAKVPAFVLAGLLTARALLISDKARKILWAARHLWMPLCGLLLWVPIHELAAGRLSVQALTEVVANQGMALVALLSIVINERNNSSPRLLVWIAVSTLMVSVMTAYLQFFGVSAAWSVYEQLRPIAIDTLGARLLSVQLSGLPGLAQGAVQHTYFMLAFGGFALAYALLAWQAPRSYRALALGAFLMLPPLLMLSRSRSGLWLTLGLAVAAFLYVGVRYRGGQARQLALPALMALGIVSALGRVTTLADFQGVSLSKLESVYDYDRKDVAAAAVTEITESPIIGVGEDVFVAKYGILAHNTFLNAGVVYGVLGILLLVWFYFGVWHAGTVSRRVQFRTGSSWIRTGALFGILGYIANGMFHNESVITGGPLGAIVAAIWFSGCRAEIEETISQPSTINHGRACSGVPMHKRRGDMACVSQHPPKVQGGLRR